MFGKKISEEIIINVESLETRVAALEEGKLPCAAAWQIADPLPILTKTKDEEDSDDKESLESIIKKGSRNNDKKENNDNSESSDDESPGNDH